MANIKVKKAVKKTVKSSGNSPAKRSSKQKRIGQARKLSVKKTTSKEKQQKAKKVTNNSAKKTSKKTTSKKATTKVAVQRKPSNKGVFKAKNTLKVRRTNVNELKKVENVIEKLSQGPEPSVQKTVPVVQEIAPTARRTVPGVLRIVHDVQDTVPSAPKAIPIVEARNFLKKCVKQYWASA